MVDPYSLYSSIKSVDPTNVEEVAELPEQTLTGHFELSPHTSLDQLVHQNDVAMRESGAPQRAADVLTQGDGLNDRIDTDYDNDNIQDKLDTDFDNDGLNDRFDTDMDNDNIQNRLDKDSDNDGITDKLDTDMDNDGLNDRIDYDRH